MSGFRIGMDVRWTKSGCTMDVLCWTCDGRDFGLDVDVDIHPGFVCIAGRTKKISARKLDWTYSWIRNLAGRTLDVSIYVQFTSSYLRAVYHRC